MKCSIFLFAAVVLLGSLWGSDSETIEHIVTPQLRDLTKTFVVSVDTVAMVAVDTLAGSGVKLVPETSKILDRDPRVLWMGASPDTTQENLWVASIDPGLRATVAIEGQFSVAGIGPGINIWHSSAGDIDIDMDSDNDGDENVDQSQDANPKEQAEDAKEDKPNGAICAAGVAKKAVVRRLLKDDWKNDSIVLERQNGNYQAYIDDKPLFKDGKNTSEDLRTHWATRTTTDLHLTIVGLTAGTGAVKIHRRGIDQQGAEEKPDDEVAITVVKAHIERQIDGDPKGYRQIDNSNRNILIGQYADFRVVIEPNTFIATAWHWTIAGTTFKDYQVAFAYNTDAAGEIHPSGFGRLSPIAPYDFQASSAQFYWSSGTQTTEVKCTVSIKEVPVPINAVASINVQSPDSTYSAKIGTLELNTKDAAPNAAWLLTAGKGMNGGIDFAANVTMPKGYPVDSGKTLYVQLVTTKNTLVTSATAVPPFPKSTALVASYFGLRVLDTQFPYAPGEGPDLIAPGTTSDAVETGRDLEIDDNPNLPLITGFVDAGGIHGDYEMYLMFLPPEPKARYVPLKKIDWSISGEAVYANNKWAIKPGTKPSATLQKAIAVNIHPVWENNVANNGSADFPFSLGTIIVDLPSTIQENADVITGKVTISQPLSKDIAILISADDPLITPAQVTIPKGSTSVDIKVNITDDNIKNGTRFVKIQANDGSGLQLFGFQGSVVIVDND